ncbi:GroES-like protein [Epithele typhae]|uniref:GroES-like protein n=1 Tax=Epithele typhae TaxID=378194 RepID=UPI002008A27A|nr:GroES-like protein [Epithele typhae]KAH9921195.1 GroES-like protein [Epithele typhae]
MSSTVTQKALVLPALGEHYAVADISIHAPGPGEVLVKIESTGLNPIDWKMLTTYSASIYSFPFVAGHEASGTVVEVGPQVDSLAVGDIIVFQGGFSLRRATFQQYCVVPVVHAAKVPSNVSPDEAATVAEGLMTALVGLYNTTAELNGKSLSLPPPWSPEGATKYIGQPVFILGGASSVGQNAIQVAKLAGHSPIITTASLHNAAFLQSLGATHVLDRRLSDDAILAELRTLTDSGAPLSLAYDAIALPETQPVAYRALAEGGRLVVVLPEQIPQEVKTPGDGKTVVFPFGHVCGPGNSEFGAEVFARLFDWLEKGVIKPNKVEILPNGLAGIPGGLARMEANKTSAVKLIAHPQETL